MAADPLQSTQAEPPPEGRFARLVGHAPQPVSAIPVEAREMQGHRAGLVTRLIADSIDFVVLILALLGIYAGWSVVVFLLDPRGFSFPAVTFGQAVLAGMVILGGYLTVGWWLTGRTYGKHVMGLRVVNIRGDRMYLGGAAARALLCVVFPIGLFWVLISPANRSVADVVIRSSVTYDWSVRAVPRQAE